MKIEDINNDITVIGVDFGGTNIRAGKVAEGKIQKAANRLVPKTDNAEFVVDTLIDAIREVFDFDIAGIGVGVPSLVDYKTGMIYSMQNIPAWKNIPLRSLLEKEFNVPVYVNNDANCFAAGECFFGEGRRFDDFVGLITGTGLGAGIINQRHLVPGINCGAGEFGVIPYLEHNFEVYASGHFFDKFYGNEAYVMAQKASKGDADAIKAFEEYGKHLGVVIKSIIACLNPEAIIIGGGISNAFKLYSNSMWEEVKNYEFFQCIDKIEIIPSNLPGIAVLGAAALYHNVAHSVSL